MIFKVTPVFMPGIAKLQRMFDFSASGGKVNKVHLRFLDLVISHAGAFFKIMRRYCFTKRRF
jgi:hypothetical protein